MTAQLWTVLCRSTREQNLHRIKRDESRFQFGAEQSVSKAVIDHIAAARIKGNLCSITRYERIQTKALALNYTCMQ